LSDEALGVIDEWLMWLITGGLDADGPLAMFREGMQTLP